MRILQSLVFLVCLAPVFTGHATAADDQAISNPTQREIDAILARSSITLPDLFRLAVLVNPDLAVARSEVQIRTGRVTQAGLYPNPELTLAVEDLSLADADNHTLKVGLSQALIVGGRRGAATDAARALLASADHGLRQQRRESLRRVHRLWARQLYFREAEAVFDELLAVAESTLEIARTRFEARAAPESHVTKALLEVYELEVARQSLGRDRITAAAEFAAFFGGLALPLDRLSGTLDQAHVIAPEKTDIDEIVKDHPLLSAARMRIAGAEAAQREAAAARIPDLGFFVAYGNREPHDENFVEGGVSIPLPLFDRNQGRLAETRSLVVQAEHQQRIVAKDLAAKLVSARQRHDLLHEQLAAFGERIAPAARRGFDQAQAAYRVGRLVFLELVDAQRTLAGVRLRTLELRKDLALADADLSSLVGTGPYADPGDEQ